MGFWIGFEGGVGICLGNVVRSFDFSYENFFIFRTESLRQNY